MLTEVVYPRPEDRTVTITTYVLEPSPAGKRPAIVVFPGGAFTHLSWREAEPVAKKFLAAGFDAFILRYSLLDKTKYPDGALWEASYAVWYVREHADEWGIDPHAVFITGFSAGGHLAGSLGTRWHEPALRITEDMPFGQNRPDGMLLCYPVLDGSIHPHETTIRMSCGSGENDPAPEQVRNITVMNHVDDRTPPTFLWHCSDDDSVPTEHSLRMARALAEHRIPFELRIYPVGGHGISLATEEICMNNPALIKEDIAEWIRLAIRWCLVLAGKEAACDLSED